MHTRCTHNDAFVFFTGRDAGDWCAVWRATDDRMNPPASISSLHHAREQRLASLQQRFDLHRASFPAEWCDYGSDDPVGDAEHLVNPCTDCGALPQLVGDGVTWTATCACGAQAPAAKMRWQAWLQWNRSPLSIDPSWRELPFFFIAELGEDEARHKLARLREHLELRSNLEGARRVCGHRVGSAYLQRLKAYHGWCCYAQELLKRQSVVQPPARHSAPTIQNSRHA
jgi:hypothetical protein